MSALLKEPSLRNPSLNTSNRDPVRSSVHGTIGSRHRKSTITSLLRKEARDDLINKAGPTANLDTIERKSKQKVIFGLILMLMSGVLYSLLATLVKWAFDLGYSAAEILMYRASVQMIVAATSYFISWRKMRKKGVSTQNINDGIKKSVLKPKQIAAIIGRGMFGAGSTFTYFTGTTLIDVGDCVTLKALAAVFTSFAGYLILKDPITVKHGIALIFAMIACVLITQPPMIFNAIEGRSSGDFSSSLPGYIVSTASSGFQAGVYICIKLAGKVPAVVLIFSQGTFSCILGALVLIFVEKSIHFFGHGIWQEYVCIICICGIGYVSQWTLTRGGQLLIAGLASLMRATDIAWSFVWGIIFFKQYPNYLTIIGAVTMFSSVFMVSLEKIKKAAQKNQEDEKDEIIQDGEEEVTVHTTDVWTVSVENSRNRNRYRTESGGGGGGGSGYIRNKSKSSFNYNAPPIHSSLNSNNKPMVVENVKKSLHYDNEQALQEQDEEFSDEDELSKECTPLPPEVTKYDNQLSTVYDDEPQI